MKARRTNRKRRTETGIALLISIFVLLLISVVAIALVVSSGTESALAGNYRSSTGVYYAALSGLEEARGRLLSKNPDSFNNTAPGFLPSPGTTLAIGSVAYVLNPGPTEVAANILTTYPDTEYDNEFGSGSLAGATVTTTNSAWNRSPLNGLNIPGPLYKWVRINAVSEKSLNIDVDADNRADSITPLYYDGAHFSNNTSAGPQALELTSLATLPNGSQKILQYLVTPIPIALPPFPAALTIAGSVTGTSSTVAYSAPASNAGFLVKGIDQNCSASPTGSKVPAVGVFNSTDTPVVITGIPSSYQSTNYPGVSLSPDVEVIYTSFPPAMRTPAGLDAVVQSIIQNADVVITPTSGPAPGSSLPSSMYTPSPKPMTVVVNGDLDLTGWHNTGYGLLLVTGNLTYDPDASWNGIVMVVGQGQVTGSRGGSGEFDGAFLVARTRDNAGVLLTGSNLGNSSVNFNAGSSMGGTGIRYSNCWIQKSQLTGGYKILSFHEISQ